MPIEFSDIYYPTKRRNRQRWLLILLLIALILLNYPFLLIVDNIFSPPAILLALFGGWAIIISLLIWIMRPGPE